MHFALLNLIQIAEVDKNVLSQLILYSHGAEVTHKPGQFIINQILILQGLFVELFLLRLHHPFEKTKAFLDGISLLLHEAVL